MSQAQLEGLLASATPFIDVRAPGEFAAGTVPGAINLPLLNDQERHEVGLTYKLKGNAAAVARGEALVSGAIKRGRIESWLAAAAAHPGIWLYCWRGGMRSEIAQRWLAESGCDVPRIAGGFKALRRCCLGVLERAADEKRWLVLAGRTGSGKTALLRGQPHAIDLEALANHRGSAFGARDCPQPAPVTFECSLAVAFLRLAGGNVLVEDESRTIGRLALPAAWHRRMQHAPLAVLEISLAERVANIRREYVDEPLARGVPPEALYATHRAALDRIRKRLGGLRHAEVGASLELGFATSDHERWIEQLLRWYYDPMYDYQLAQKEQRIIARGNSTELRSFLQAELENGSHDG